MNTDYSFQNPNIRIQQSTPTPNYDSSFDTNPSYFSSDFQIPQEWQMYQGHNSFGGGVQALHNTGYQSKHHQRTASESTVGSLGPASPYTQNATYPSIANTDRSPSSAAHYDSAQYGDDSSTGFPKSLPTPSQTPTSDTFHNSNSMGYLPSQLSHTPAAHVAMKNMAIDHHNTVDETPDFGHSSRQSVSSYGRDSPSTPREDQDDKLFKVPNNGEQTPKAEGDSEMDVSLFLDDLTDYRQPAPRVELFRTESAAYQDELFNPANLAQQPSQPTHQAPTQNLNTNNNNLLSPHRSLVNERIRTANRIRSQSPAQPLSRERSPFRQGSSLAPTDGYHSPGPVLGSAAADRIQRKQEADALAMAQHHPTLRREPTKTISPKDAMLDYNETDEDANMPLFNDNIPIGYQKHLGGTETFPNNFISGTNQAFGGMTNSGQPNITGFRATNMDGASGAGGNYNFLPPSSAGQLPSNYNQQSYRPANNYTSTTDPTPDFPAHLTSMESSVSEGPPASSQGSMTTSTIQRPANTQANTGTYTCTYHGCTERFESPTKLQKHKRDAHRSARETQSATDTAETSPKSSASPGPLGSHLSSSALLARNSQAGPHKCTRINPSTGKPCDTIFSRPYDLTRHEDTIHNRGKQKVRCEYCREEKTFSRNDALTRHMRVVHPEVDFQGKRGGKKGDY